MSRPVITVDGLSKAYRIGIKEQRSTSLREALLRALKSPVRRFQKLRERTTGDDIIWALKNISFEVHEGEVLGIIGRNGAGKSTLLKILSRITEPTEGTAVLRGRVASLLEVGVGFNPELTGRENVYMSGALHGLKKAEIDRRFDEIVDFAGIEKFIDTPVKRYSSGMRLRLGFAVAANLNPEVLLVDEVLAVGDAGFRRRCLTKMQDVAAGEGNTVLFVSHNMPAVCTLCDRVVVLHEGEVVYSGGARCAVDYYLGMFNHNPGATSLQDAADRKGSGPVRFVYLRLENAEGREVDQIISGERVRIVLGYHATQEMPRHSIGVAIELFTTDRFRLTNLWSVSSTGSTFAGAPSEGEFVCELPKVQLREGSYIVDLYCSVDGITSDYIRHAAVLNVVDGPYYGFPNITTRNCGVIFMDHAWELRPLSPQASNRRPCGADQ